MKTRAIAVQGDTVRPRGIKLFALPYLFPGFSRLISSWHILGLVALVVAVYRTWLAPGLVTAGDFPYFTLAYLREGLELPALWQPGIGTGGYDILGLPMAPIYILEGLVAHAGIDWTVSERLFWIFPAVAIPCAATYVLSLSLFGRPIAALVSALAVVMNSYVYLLYEGGQFGVAVAYGCLPLIVWTFIRGQRRGTLRSYILTGFCMAVQAVYDIRSTYITLGVLLVYGLFSLNTSMGGRATWGMLFHLLQSLGLPQLLVGLATLAVLHAWWLLPAIFVRAPALPSSYTDVSGVNALSLMNLSNGLALFHPFWFANNVHVSTINPLFFLVPLPLFALLLRHYDRTVLFLVAVALLAVFLVKGDNAPAGVVYEWLFLHLPGFSLFRDPSKFYQPLALVYALLLGRAADEGHRFMRNVGRGLSWSVAPTLFLLVLAVLPAYPAALHQVRGTFVSDPVPSDYVQLNSLINQQRGFFRVLWVPARSRFGTASMRHPSLDAALGSPCCVPQADGLTHRWAWLAAPTATRALTALSVRYVVVPDSPEGDAVGTPGEDQNIVVPSHAILLSVRHYLPGLHETTIGHLHIFTNQVVYPLINSFPLSTTVHCLFRSTCANTYASLVAPSVGSPIVSVGASAASWLDVRVRRAKRPFYIGFQQTYDPHWAAYLEPDGAAVQPWFTFFQQPLPSRDHVIVNGYANAWLLHKMGNYHVILVYWPEWLVLLGICIAVAAGLVYGVVALRGWSRYGWVRRIRDFS